MISKGRLGVGSYASTQRDEY